MLTRRSAITFISYAPNLKIEKPNNLKVFGSNKTKGPKQDSQICYAQREKTRSIFDPYKMFKKSLTILMGYPEAVNQRTTDNTIVLVMT